MHYRATYRAINTLQYKIWYLYPVTLSCITTYPEPNHRNPCSSVVPPVCTGNCCLAFLAPYYFNSCLFSAAQALSGVNMKKYFGGGVLLLLAAAVQQLLLLPARAAEGSAVLGAPAKSSPEAITSRAPQHETPGGFSDLSVTIEDGETEPPRRRIGTGAPGPFKGSSFRPPAPAQVLPGPQIGAAPLAVPTGRGPSTALQWICVIFCSCLTP